MTTHPPSFLALDGELPAALGELLQACAGDEDEFGERLAWTREDICARNLEMRSTEALRSLYMPFDHLLFFSAAGDGDLFALAVDADGQVRRPDVFVWEHETDSRRWFAGGAGHYLALRRGDRE